ncbi:uncharacterized protein LOC112213571 [Bombus impatiens]|uniref:Uncharacterized protein LOC112213571 n=1 Tax=Bombus impatiens TaxID=132113 RepID=A0A6P6FH36_BOMIM|nr:uncharacterized protein LOC112213571 [Bombus impatiens]
MLLRRVLEVNVTVVRNPSMTIERTTITLRNEHFPDITDLFIDVETICDEQPFRIYCRISERDYVPVYNFISFKGGFELICSPKLYVVVDEPVLDTPSTRSGSRDSIRKSSYFGEISSRGSEEFKVKSDVPSTLMLSDIEILQCALSILKECDDDPGVSFRYLFVNTPPLHGRELKDTDRQVKVLVKGFPRPKAKPSHEPFPEVRNILSQATSKGSKKRRT